MTILTLHRSAFAPLASFENFAKTVKAVVETGRQRRALARLDSAALTDLGLSTAEVKAELSKPFWDLSCQFGH